MKIETYLFGAVEVSPEKVVTFPNGLVGFEESKRFMLAHAEGKVQPTSYTLQSLDEPTLAFEIVDPTTLGFNYELALTDADNALPATCASTSPRLPQPQGEASSLTKL